MKVRLGVVLLTVTFVLSACGGGGSGSAMSPLPAGPRSASPDGVATVQLVVPSVAAPSTHRHKPAFVSPATQAATVTAAGTTTVVDLSAASTACTVQQQGRVCSIQMHVTYGPVTFTVTTYDRAPQNGALPPSARVLGHGSVTQTITAASPSIAVAIDAVVGGFGSLPSFSSWPADGSPHSYGFALNPVDFDNAPISNGSSDPYTNPISITLVEYGGSGHAHLVFDGQSSGASAVLSTSADTVAVAYDGGGSPGYYVSVSFAASGVTAVTTTLSPIFVTSTSPSFSNRFLALTGPSSSATFAIHQAQAAGVSYNVAPNNCTNIASTTQPSLPATGAPAFVITGGTAPSGGGCTFAVSDGSSTLTIGVSNAPPGQPTPTPTVTPSPTPSAAPTSTPTATPTATPTVAPTATPTPLVTPAPLPTSIYVSNGYVWNTFPLAAAQAAGGTYNAAPATTISYSTYTSYFAVDKLHNLIWLAGGHAFPASWNGTAPSPVATFSGGGSGGIAVDAAGTVYAAGSSFPSEYIYIYPYGSTTPGTTITLPATVQGAVSLQLDAAGNIYVSDNSNNAVDVVANPGTNAGAVTGTVTRTISGPFNRNWGICLDSSGRIYVVDTNGPSGTVDIFAAGTTNAASGTAIETISSSAFGGTPEFCDVDSSGDLWVTDLYDVQEFTASQISTNLGGSISAAANRIGGALTTLNSATGIYVR